MGESWAPSLCLSRAGHAGPLPAVPWLLTTPAHSPAKNSFTSSEPQLRAKASGMLGPQRENALFPPKRRSAPFSSPFYKSSTFPGENTVHRQSDVSMEHQCQKQIICHQTFFLKPGIHCSTTGVPYPGLMEDSSAPPQFLAERGKSKPRAPRVSFESMQIQQLVPASVSPPGQGG